MDSDTGEGTQEMKITVKDENGLKEELKRLSNLELEAVKKKTLTQMLNRARAAGGTPVDSGDLRKSSRISEDEMGYGMEYAAHVEYGHRTRGGGFVSGQHYLKKNVDTQGPIFEQDVLDRIRKI